MDQPNVAAMPQDYWAWLDSGELKPLGVYFLIKEGELCYVGQTRNVWQRLQTHRMDPKREPGWFTHVAFLPVPMQLLDVVESYYIHTFKPRKNGPPPIRCFENIEKRILELHVAETMNEYLRARLERKKNAHLDNSSQRP